MISFQAASALECDVNAFFRSAGSLWIVPPGMVVSFIDIVYTDIRELRRYGILKELMKNRESVRRSKSRNKKLLVTLIIIVILGALTLVGYGAWQLWLRHQATNNPNPVVSTQIVTHSTDSPDETKPTEACASYKAAAQNPERISIPSLQVEGCIESVGIDQHGAVAVPTNIHVAGWFVDSARPGEPGVSIIDGHINGNFTNDGIFQHLDALKQGDMFTVKKGDGTELTYETVSVRSVPLDEAAEVLFSHDPAIISQINLITCGGSWNEEIKQFDHRIIAIAKLVN